MALKENSSIDEMLKTLHKLPINVDVLCHWIGAIEITAKHMCNDMNDSVVFQYSPENPLKYYVRDSRSRDCLVKAIEINLPFIPELLQGFFSVLKYNLKNVKFPK